MERSRLPDVVRRDLSQRERARLQQPLPPNYRETFQFPAEQPRLK